MAVVIIVGLRLVGLRLAMVVGVEVVMVFSFIETEEEAVAVVELMVQFGIDVIEVIVVLVGITVLFVHNEVFQKGGVCAACAEAE